MWVRRYGWVYVSGMYEWVRQDHWVIGEPGYDHAVILTDYLPTDLQWLLYTFVYGDVFKRHRRLRRALRRDNSSDLLELLAFRRHAILTTSLSLANRHIKVMCMKNLKKCISEIN